MVLLKRAILLAVLGAATAAPAARRDYETTTPAYESDPTDTPIVYGEESSSTSVYESETPSPAYPSDSSSAPYETTLTTEVPAYSGEAPAPPPPAYTTTTDVYATSTEVPAYPSSESPAPPPASSDVYPTESPVIPAPPPVYNPVTTEPCESTTVEPTYTPAPPPLWQHCGEWSVCSYLMMLASSTRCIAYVCCPAPCMNGRGSIACARIEPGASHVHMHA